MDVSESGGEEAVGDLEARWRPSPMGTAVWRSWLEDLSLADVIHRAIALRAFPGASVAFGTASRPVLLQSFGTQTFESLSPVSNDSLWDLASLTKVIVTVTSVMVLFDRRLIDLDLPACHYLPSFSPHGKHLISVRMLLTHTAGLCEFYPFLAMGLSSRQQVVDFVMRDTPRYPPGTVTRYSDLSMLVLGLLVEAVAGVPLDQFAEEAIFRPLGMAATAFRPVGRTPFDPTVVPTEFDAEHRGTLLWGEVHDPTAWLMGGVAGHAGLFSSIRDVARFAQCMLAGGSLPSGARLVSPATLRLFSQPPAPSADHPRPFALGWDTAARRGKDGYTSAGCLLGPSTFGHTGFTGTSLWMDPGRNFFVVLLTNSVHAAEPVEEDRGTTIRQIRPLVADAAVVTLNQLCVTPDILTWHMAAGETTVANKPWPSFLKDASTETLNERNDAQTQAPGLSPLRHPLVGWAALLTAFALFVLW